MLLINNAWGLMSNPYKLVLVGFLLIVSPASLSAESDRMDILRSAKIIICKFNRAALTDYKDGELVLGESFEDYELTFDSIDFENGRARMVSTSGVVQAFYTGSGATFIEGAGYDNHSFTTVFPVPAKTNGEFIAVQSVHALEPGIRLKSGQHFYAPKQRYGSCKLYPTP